MPSNVPQSHVMIEQHLVHLLLAAGALGLAVLQRMSLKILERGLAEVNSVE